MIKRYFYLFCLLSLLFLFSSCTASHTYTAKEITRISLKGQNGNATITVQPDYQKASDIVDEVITDKHTDFDMYRLEMLFYEGVKYSLSGSTENLSNGDKVTITMTYSKDNFKKYNIAFKSTKFTYTVSGLE